MGAFTHVQVVALGHVGCDEELLGLLPRPVLRQLHAAAAGTLLLGSLLLGLGRGGLLLAVRVDNHTALLTLGLALALSLGFSSGNLGSLVGHLAVDKLDNVLEGAVLAHELEGGLGAHTLDGLEVVAAEEDTELDELTGSAEMNALLAHLVHGHLQTLERFVKVDLGDGHLLSLGEGQVAEEDRRVEGECVHVL